MSNHNTLITLAEMSYIRMFITVLSVISILGLFVAVCNILLINSSHFQKSVLQHVQFAICFINDNDVKRNGFEVS